MSSEAEPIPLISNGLYRIVNDLIGSDCIVKQRREGLNKLSADLPYTLIISGSRGEGFEMESSDFDVMEVLNDVVVVPSSLSLTETDLPQKDVLTYDTDCTSPGFAVIRCTYRAESIELGCIADSLVSTSIGPCVSSKLFRERILEVAPLAEIHGPCVSGATPAAVEIDYVYCLKCPYWPREAYSFKTRSSRTGWPSQEVVTDICNDGCLFVPISSKQLHCRDAFESEWRMSFSLAEKKLVHSMNHCQFLCYGLLKLILNEVLKKKENIKDLLCSYYMKTAVFWEISEDATGWTIQNFLCKFWSTFGRLLNWVQFGYCPNFFNPENNMFAGKVDGHRQKLLMEVLRSFHHEGEQFLLKCPSLNKDLKEILRNPNIATFAPVEEEKDTLELYSEFFSKWHSVTYVKGVFFVNEFRQSYPVYTQIQKNTSIISSSNNMNNMVDVLKFANIFLVQRFGEEIVDQLERSNFDYSSNKGRKNYIHIAINILRVNYVTFCEKNILIAKSFYKLGVYHSAIRALNKVRTKLQSSQFVYWWALNESNYRRLRHHDMSFETFLNSHIVDRVWICEGNRISELDIELKAGKEKFPFQFLQIHPMVFVNFLLLLSYHHLGDRVRRDDVLSDLRLLVLCDDGHRIPFFIRAISWEILGICQQLCGDHQGAYQSYTNALNDKCSVFKTATIIRLRSLGYE